MKETVGIKIQIDSVQKMKMKAGLKQTLYELRKHIVFEGLYFLDKEGCLIHPNFEQEIFVEQVIGQENIIAMQFTKNIQLKLEQMAATQDKEKSLMLQEDQLKFKQKINEKQQHSAQDKNIFFKNYQNQNPIEQRNNETEFQKLLIENNIYPPIFESKYINKIEGLHYLQYPILTQQDFSQEELQKLKVLLFVGQTGSGKSTMIDSIVNFVLGVQINYPYRYKIVDEEWIMRKKQNKTTASITEEVQNYYIKSSLFEYPILIIDTPGFMDTDGLERDKMITSQIYNHLRQQVSKIDYVCLISMSNQARLTVSQQYVYSRILELFGKDIEENIVNMLTFCDNGKPQVSGALKALNISLKYQYKFNNYSIMNLSDQKKIDEIYFKMSYESLDAFFKLLRDSIPVSIKLTNQILKEKGEVDQLTKILQNKIIESLEKLYTQIQMLNENQGKKQIQISQGHQMEYYVQKKKNYNQGFYSNNCTVCKITCHHTCEEQNECYLIMQDKCRTCPLNCPAQKHKKENFHYEVEQVSQQKIQGQQNKYKQQEQIPPYLAQEIVKFKQEILKDLIELQCSLDRLYSKSTQSTNSMKQNVLDIIENFITQEKSHFQPNQQFKLQAYQMIKDEYLQLIRAKETNDKEAVQKFLQNENQIIDKIEIKKQCSNCFIF